MFGTSPSQPLSWGVVDGVSSKLRYLGCLVDFLKKVSPSIVWLEAYIKWYSPWYQQHNTTRLIRIVGSTNFATSRYTLFNVLTFLFLLSPEILLLPQHSSFFGILPSGWIVFSRWRTRASTCNHTHLNIATSGVFSTLFTLHTIVCLETASLMWTLAMTDIYFTSSSNNNIVVLY